MASSERPGHRTGGRGRRGSSWERGRRREGRPRRGWRRGGGEGAGWVNGSGEKAWVGGGNGRGKGARLATGAGNVSGLASATRPPSLCRTVSAQAAAAAFTRLADPHSPPAAPAFCTPIPLSASSARSLGRTNRALHSNCRRFPRHLHIDRNTRAHVSSSLVQRAMSMRCLSPPHRFFLP